MAGVLMTQNQRLYWCCIRRFRETRARHFQYLDHATWHHGTLIILAGFFIALCCWLTSRRDAGVCIAGLASSHTGSTLLRFHLDWARTSHQWRWPPRRWLLPPDHQMFTIPNFQPPWIAKILHVEKALCLNCSLARFVHWNSCHNIISSSTSNQDHNHHCQRDDLCQRDDHAGCIGELDPGGAWEPGEWRNKSTPAWTTTRLS